MKSKKNIFIWIRNVAIPLLVGGLVGSIMSKFIDYDILNKPPFSPPAVIFPVMWTILYILMGVSYSILETKSLNDRNIKVIYFIQLFFNAMWSIIFFVFKLRFLSIIWILVLLIFVIYMIVLFYRKNKLASFLQLPYLFWIIFASYLNIGVYLLN